MSLNNIHKVIHADDQEHINNSKGCNPFNECYREILKLRYIKNKKLTDLQA